MAEKFDVIVVGAGHAGARCPRATAPPSRDRNNPHRRAAPWHPVSRMHPAAPGAGKRKSPMTPPASPSRPADSESPTGNPPMIGILPMPADPA